MRTELSFLGSIHLGLTVFKNVHTSSIKCLGGCLCLLDLLGSDAVLSSGSAIVTVFLGVVGTAVPLSEAWSAVEDRCCLALATAGHHFLSGR